MSPRPDPVPSVRPRGERTAAGPDENAESDTCLAAHCGNAPYDGSCTGSGGTIEKCDGSAAQRWTRG
ncbi:hypothetical protein [Streptomyces griseomycini]|uniref:Uncharacterized protein n=1 Tax=Streptomyces griseomycini TaxID=66895 RepID=A0A7W7PXC5_9ACTN|nr:hypothetical protein [Streptomyces griseomycini]MBB4903092.1 hypothetical protein [Streptomyces griseomycini]